MQWKHFISAIVIASLLSPLSWAYTGGSGTPADPYQISAVADWQELMTTTTGWDKHFILTADLDLQGLTLNPVGTYDLRFTGVFDGNGHIIRNAVIELPDSDDVGLFGCLGSGGELCDLGVEDVNITGGDYVGGLVGYNDWGTLTSCYATGQVTGDRCVGGLLGQTDRRSTLTSCYATGHVTGDVFVGGLLGRNDYGTLTSCYATGDVTGDRYVGGLVGENWGTLISCYATGQVTGEWGDVGGLVGYNYGGTLTSCYAAGDVTGTSDYVGGLVGENAYGLITACFWDRETSGQFTSDGGEGKTTAQMHDINTFLDAGWDFVGETVNGSDDIWRMCIDGVSYPLLYWQFTRGDFVCPDGVDFVDFAAFSPAWLSDDTPTSNWNPACDISEPPDGSIDERDLAVFCENWLAGR